MSHKHIISDSKAAVSDALRGLVFAHSLEYDAEQRIVYRKADSSRVSILSGGGSGHEPAHAGFVGDGMLSAAIAGSIFASPSSKQIRAAIEHQRDAKGVLLVVKNYTGDVLHFAQAKEKAQSADSGLDVRMVIVGDDVAVGREAGALVGRRGLAATVLVYKIAGALAAQDGSLDDVERIAGYVAAHSATIGAGLEHTHVPGTDPEESHLKENEAELGMGIHNEQGFTKIDLSSVQKLVADMLDTLTSQEDKDRGFLTLNPKGRNRVVLLVNNLGGLSELELGVVVKEAGSWLHERHYGIDRVLSGTFMTSLNMPGFSISLIQLPNEALTKAGQLTITADSILEWLDAPCQAPGWKHQSNKPPRFDALKAEDKSDKSKTKNLSVSESKAGPRPTDEKTFVAAIQSACESVIKAEPEITKLDKVLGDGDAGETLKAGASAVLDQIKSTNDLNVADVAATLREISDTLEESMGGTSGALYSIFFSALAGKLQSYGQDAEADAKIWSGSVEAALNTLLRYTHARPPSRTLVDPLAAFVTTFTFDSFDKAVVAAREAADNTAYLESKVGRTAYLDKKSVKDSQLPDAGATGVVKLLEGIQSALRNR